MPPSWQTHHYVVMLGCGQYVAGLSSIYKHLFAQRVQIREMFFVAQLGDEFYLHMSAVNIPIKIKYVVQMTLRQYSP